MSTATRVMEHIADAGPIGLSELARALQLPKSTVQRYLLSLHAAGWLETVQGENGKWIVSERLARIFSNDDAGTNVRDIALPFLNKLQIETQETVHLSVPRGRLMLLVERIDTSHSLRAFLPVGGTSEMHTCASGVAYLSQSNPSVITAYSAGVFQKLTDKTIGDAVTLEQALETARDQGYAVNDQGLSEGICSVGCAIVGSTGVPVGAVSVSGPESRMNSNALNTYGEMARAIAKEISLAWRSRR